MQNQNTTRGWSYIEPGQTASWSPEWTFVLSACAALNPTHGPHPISRIDRAKIVLLIVKRRRYVVAQ